MSQKNCFNCGQEGAHFYGYVICDSCKSDLGLFTDETIKKHLSEYRSKDRSYAEEIDYRLDFVEKDYIKKKIKLLHIQDRLNNM